MNRWMNERIKVTVKYFRSASIQIRPVPDCRQFRGRVCLLPMHPPEGREEDDAEGLLPHLVPVLRGLRRYLETGADENVS